MLDLGPENRERARKLAEFAARPENHYVVGESKFIPGDVPDYVIQLDTIRCVFTMTQANGKLYRHLSLSVPGGLPNPAIAYTIATWFGFTGAKIRHEDIAMGPGDDWQMQSDPLVRAVQLLQPV